MIIDSHAHLDYPQLAEDLPGVLARAREAGVDRVITIGVKLTTADQPRRCLLYTSPSPRDSMTSRMPSSA